MPRVPRGPEHDPIYSLRIYALFSGQFLFKFSLKKIARRKKKIVAPFLDVIMIAFIPRIYSEVLFLPKNLA